MKSPLLNAVCAIALMCAGAATTIALPATAQAQADISFQSFHDELARDGDWVYSDRWGEVWIPDVPDDFRPYDTDGYWAMTDDYGWVWASDYPWGDITFHYGRWVDDPDDGWLWIPGYVWAPAWVVWRSSDDVIGWMPMPPDRDFLNGSFNYSSGGLSFGINFNDPGDQYGYRDWYGPSYGEDRFDAAWVFVGVDHFGDRDYHRYVRPRASNRTFIRNTTNITNYTVVNNVIVNHSVNTQAVERASGRQIRPVQARDVMKRTNFITHVDQGRRAQDSARAAMPHGRGTVGSAPPPSQAAVNSLSDKTPARRGGGGNRTGAPQHIFTRQTVQQAPLGGQPGGQPPAQAAPNQRGPEQRGPEQRPNAPQDRRPPAAQPQPQQQAQPKPNAAPVPDQRQQQQREQQTQQNQQRQQQQDEQARARQQLQEQGQSKEREQQQRDAQQREQQRLQQTQQEQQQRGAQQRQQQEQQQQQRQQGEQQREQQTRAQQEQQRQQQQQQQRPPQAQPQPQPQQQQRPPQERRPPPKAGEGEDKKDEKRD